MKKARYQFPERKGQITVVASGNAAEQVIPLLIIFDAKNVRYAWIRNEVDTWRNVAMVLVKKVD